MKINTYYTRNFNSKRACAPIEINVHPPLVVAQFQVLSYTRYKCSSYTSKTMMNDINHWGKNFTAKIVKQTLPSNDQREYSSDLGMKSNRVQPEWWLDSEITLGYGKSQLRLFGKCGSEYSEGWDDNSRVLRASVAEVAEENIRRLSNPMAVLSLSNTQSSLDKRTALSMKNFFMDMTIHPFALSVPWVYTRQLHV